MSATSRVQFIRNFTIEPIEPLLGHELSSCGISVHCDFGGFATAADEIQHLDAATPELLVASLGLEMSSPDFGHATWDVRAACDRLLLLLREAVARSRAQLVLNTVLGPLYDVNGGARVQRAASAQADIDELNLAIRELASSEPDRIFLADWTLYARRLGEAQTYDRRFWYTTGLPFARSFLARYARDLAVPLRILAGKVRKCLVLDCDNTLWGGVVGEDGLNGIHLSDDSLPGAYFREFQRAVLDLHARGIAIALASRNNEADVMDVFERHPQMLLRQHHLAAWRVNWDDKPTSLASIAAELNIGLDALVFIDDSPVECALVTHALPAVQVLQVPERCEDLVALLQRANPFEALSITGADRSRNASFRANRKRTEFSAKLGDLDAFKRELQTQLRIRRVAVADLPRAVQLLQRTNQFNLTTRRYDAPQLREMLGNDDTLVYCAELRDRFGDLGLVGVAVVRRTEAMAVIDSLLLSCRALGRDAEFAFAGGLYDAIRSSWRPQWIEGQYVASARNAAVAEFWVRAGLPHASDPEDDVVHFRAAANAPSLDAIAPGFVTLEVNS